MTKDVTVTGRYTTVSKTLIHWQDEHKNIIQKIKQLLI